jgi:fucose 4-O-acetylase-like acetyltransferase
MAWPDVAKGIGIVLMYFGHVLARMPSIQSGQGHGASMEEMRFIYAFHMPLFFMMAGFFFRPPLDWTTQLRALVVRRLVPVVFFGVLLVPLWSAGPLRHGLSAWHELEPLAEGYLHGHPDLNWVTWFLVCLFVSECMALLVLPRLRSMQARLLGGLGVIWAGVVICNHVGSVARWLGIGEHTWFAYEAIVALGFYMVGHALLPALKRLATHRRAACVVSLLALALTAASYQLNSLAPQLTVMMSADRQGEPLPFMLTALSGSVGVMALAMVLQEVAILGWLGRMSMVFLGLSGVFFHFINAPLMLRWPPPEAALPLTLYVLLVTLVSLLIATPFAVLLMRWVPQWLGKPNAAPAVRIGADVKPPPAP